MSYGSCWCYGVTEGTFPPEGSMVFRPTLLGLARLGLRMRRLIVALRDELQTAYLDAKDRLFSVYDAKRQAEYEEMVRVLRDDAREGCPGAYHECSAPAFADYIETRLKEQGCVVERSASNPKMLHVRWAQL